MYRLLLFLIPLAILWPGSQALAQLSRGGAPPGFERPAQTGSAVFRTGRVNRSALLAADSAESRFNEPFRFGTPFETGLSPANSGVWDTLADGSARWRLKISSPEAYSINLLFGAFHLPEDARMWLYNEQRTQIIGAFDSRNNKPSGTFATAPVAGDELILEYVQLPSVTEQVELTVSRIVHAYRDIFSRDVIKDQAGFGDAGDCNVNVNCPEGELWESQKRAVVLILTGGGTRLCTGAILNNVRQDLTPFLLTADHCLGPSSTWTDWVFLFNYESPTCTDAEGPTDLSLHGSQLLASDALTDFALLQLTESPPDSFGVYYAGWDASGLGVDTAVCIHHPRGDVKKISFEFDPLAVSAREQDPGTGTGFWRVGDWDIGTTEPTSSGSPLFDANHRIIGQLYGGFAACDNDEPDWYGRLSVSWNGTTPDQRLSDWLDPDNSGVITLEGREQIPVQIFHDPLPDTRDTLKEYEVYCSIRSAVFPLDPDELQLHYNTGSGWLTEQLTAAGPPEQFRSGIPPQTAGTIIDYFLSAADISGGADTTEQYTFAVVPYALSFWPEQIDRIGGVDDTVYHEFELRNTGVFDDTLDIQAIAGMWISTLSDTLGSPVVNPIVLASGDSRCFRITVQVGQSEFGEADTVLLIAQSRIEPTATDSALAVTISAGQSQPLPFTDNFSGGTIDLGKWTYNNLADVNTSGAGEPSPPFSLNLDGNPNGADTIVSQSIDLSGVSQATLTYHWERGGNGDPTEVGDDLFIEYFSSSGQWVETRSHDGMGPVMTSFAEEAVYLPPDANHVGFRIRFRSLGAPGTSFDDWFIDDVAVDVAVPPVIAITPTDITTAVERGQESEELVIIANNGEGFLNYSTEISYPITPSMVGPLIKLLYQVDRLGQVQRYPEEYYLEATPVKGVVDERTGIESAESLGGPDQFGYYWTDSDSPEGPEFVWTDISATGTDITELISDDNYAGPYYPGFFFPYYGVFQTQIWIGSNGVLGFDSTNLRTWQNDILPKPTAPNNLIAWFWDDLIKVDESRLYVETGANECIVQWTDFARLPMTEGRLSGQAILKANGSIICKYLRVDDTFETGAATIGIENDAGTDGLEVLFNTPGYMHDSLLVVFFSPVQWLDVSSGDGVVAPGEADTLTVAMHTSQLAVGTYAASISLTSDDPDQPTIIIPAELTVLQPSGFVCGDVNGDLEGPDLADILFLADFLYLGGEPPPVLEAGDVNSSGSLDMTDVLRMASALFLGGEPMNCP